MILHQIGKKALNLTAALLLALTMVLAGCGGGDQTNGGSEPGSTVTHVSAAPSANAAASASPSLSPVPEAGQTVYPLKVKDATDTEVVFDKAPERIVTLVPSETETVFALGAGDKIVGVDKWSDYPPEAKQKPQMGDLTTNLEAVLAANPDVVLASASLNSKVIPELRKMGVKVYATNPKTIAQTIEKVELLAQVLNQQALGKKTADEMRADLQKVTDAVKNASKKRVYLEFSTGWTVGDGEFLSEMVELSGGTNIGSGKPGWYEMDPEAIIKADPEVIVYSTGAGMETLPEIIRSRTGFAGVDALKNGRLYGIDGNLTNRVGPRLTKGLVEMAKAVHPELVK
ncbi:MAG: transporter substrate-binding protein [Paenibacillaceae bacterium]|jgi:iron complex transport system substrate-binding protein|nr:transporter substrate-binding protein [Paenibacillaceae bacterium]